MTKYFSEISDTIQNYFDGLYEGNIEKLKSAFHEECHLFSSSDDFSNWSRDKWLEIVENRDSPEKLGLDRHDKIVFVDLADENTALAKIQLAIPPRYFTDYLSLIRINGNWKIISKTYKTEIHN
ncbi:MAG: hypothetical protein CMM30_02705 [Rhodospirillaceae bacterium]|nr:hypothetical protein [Rhodospirillaceae bacterium]|tara:strand:- start:6725 stop:7096 length:372 start_codon:yes stop_codon:yes gene_type:complete